MADDTGLNALAVHKLQSSAPPRLRPAAHSEAGTEPSVVLLT